MKMGYLRSALGLGAFAALASPAIAHPDDPKLLDRVPRYEGPSYRAAVDRAEARGTFDSFGITLQANITLPEFGSHANGNDCWGYVSPSGREYALMGLEGGTGFVEVTNPGNPQIVDVIAGGVSLWRDIKVFGQYAYAVNETGGGIQVFDLSDIDNGNVTLVRNVTTGGTGETHNVAIDTDSGYLYRCGGGNSSIGLRIYDLNTTPDNPVFVGSWMDRYVHDAQAHTMQSGPWAGREIVFACTGANNGFVDTGLDILDVTNKSNIQNLGRLILPSGEYSHQCWLTADEQHVILNDELDEQNLGNPPISLVIDVSDLTDPQLVDSFTNNQNAITHNNYIKGSYFYASNYTDGLRIFDIADLFNATEVAFFDTRPESSGPTFNGLWSNYPYFPSGTVIGSDLERGLFVWEVQLPGLIVDFVAENPETIDPGGASYQVSITPRDGHSLVPGTELLWIDDGSGFQSYPLIDLGGGEYLAQFPALGCPASIDFYVAAEDDQGVIVTDPPFAPSNVFSALTTTGTELAFQDNMETDTGWLVGAPGDTATTGIWERVDPVGTSAQPEDDNPDGGGTLCWITGQHEQGQSIGFNDVDNGPTTLFSPVLDATSDTPGEAVVSFHYWYSNSAGANPGTDTFSISMSDDGGVTWVPVEDISATSGQWEERTYTVSDYVTPTSLLRLRFVARDDDPGSIVEAGIDDLDLTVFLCSPGACEGDTDGNGAVDISDISFVIFRLGDTGTPGEVEGDADGNGMVDAADISYVIFRLGNVCD